MRLDPSKLKAARGERPQSEVAATAGMKQPNYARIESGERTDPQLSTAVRVARALGVPLESLFAPEKKSRK